MNILYLDSATEACTAGVAFSETCLCDFEIAPRGHAQRLLPMAEQLLARAGVDFAALDLVAFGRGPGSFTGVRIATAMAQGIAMARDLPMLGISSLECLAAGAQRRFEAAGELAAGLEIRSAIDARMGEIYRAGYRVEADGRLRCTLDEAVTPPGFPPANAGTTLACGSGFGRYPELGEAPGIARCEPDALPHAIDALALARRAPAAEWIPADAAVPHYLRNRVTGP